MRVADYIMSFIHGLGVEHVFYVAGGGAMHLNDALGQSPINGVCMLHEQGAAIAAEAYGRIRNGYGVCLVTSGPGGTNALTGLVGAYMDSSPMIFLSGQVKRADLRENALRDAHIEGTLRQFGIQEVDIIPMVSPYAKYSARIDAPEDIRYELEKAAHIAREGRPGPVWLDIPLDIQASDVDPDMLRCYEPPVILAEKINLSVIDEVIRRFKTAKRPLLMLGNGIRLAGAEQAARELCEMMGVPVQTSWNGVDLIEENHPLYAGRPGIVANRADNIIVQHADFVLSIGARMGLLTTGFNFESFMGNAFHVMVDIDPLELDKKNLHPDMKLQIDAGEFIEEMLKHREQLQGGNYSSWRAHCQKLREQYPPFIPEQEPGHGYVSNYHLIREISDQMKDNDVYQFTSSGTTVDIAMKSFRIKHGQRAFMTKGLAAMGYDIPSCIGSALGSGRRVVCVTGDGSAAMNMQELEVIHRLNLPVKIFISDNHGYAMIYGSQNGNFKGRLTGCTDTSGLTLPDMGKIAAAFGIKTMRIETEGKLKEIVSDILSSEGPALCVVKTDITQPILPKQANYMKEDGQMASRPLDDMAPLLPRDEYECLRNRAD